MTDYSSFALSGGPVAIGGNPHNAAVADNGNILVMGTEVVTYSGATYRNFNLVAQLYDHAGQPIGEKVSVASRGSYNEYQAYGPGALDVDALTGGGFVTAYYAYPAHGGPGSEVHIAVFSPSGALLKTMQLGSAYGSSDISVEPLGNGGFVVAATSAGKYDAGRSYVQTFDASGTATSQSTEVGTAADVLVSAVGDNGYVVVAGKLKYFDGAAFQPDVTLPAGVTVAAADTLSTGKVVFLSTRYDGAEYDLYSLTFDPATNSLGAPTLIHSDAKPMSTLAVEALPGGGYVVSWGNENYASGAKVAFTVGPSGAKSDLFTFEGTLLGAFGPTDTVVSTLAFGAAGRLQDYTIGAGEAPSQTLRADNSNGQSLTGGAGDDVIYAGRASAVMTGAGGGDLFVFEALPWNAGKITDFTIGADKLDFSRLFSAANYTGSDPVADGRVFFQQDALGTRIFFDGDGSASAQSPFLITTLQGVVGPLKWAQIGGTSAGGEPPPPPPSTQIGLTNVDVSNQEGHSGATPFVYNLSRTGDTSGTSSVNWTVTATAGSTVSAEDFENGVFPNGVVTFAPGETSKQIIVNVRGDTAAEQDEPFNLNLTGVNGATLGISNGRGNILNDDVYQQPTSEFRFGVNSVTKAEGDSGATAFNFTVYRTGSGNVAATIDWSVGGHASTPATAEDFQNGVFPSGTLHFAVGETTKTLTVDVAGDTALESNEYFQVTLSNPVGAALGSERWAQGTITNDDQSGPDGGRVINSPGPGSTLTGGAGADTLNASQGPDVLTGGGGADVFRWGFEPWAPARVTDFALGSDRIDLSNLLRLYGYTGSDPVADKWVWLIDDGAGGTKVLFDRDGAGGDPQWPNYILQLEKVSVSGLTWSKLTTGGGTSEPPPPPPGDGQTITSPGPGSTLTGGAGADTLISSRGEDVLTGAGGADYFTFPGENWAPARITDFEDGVDKIDIRGMLDAIGYAGTDPFADGYLKLIDDGAGGTKVLFDRDATGANPQWPNYVFQVEKVAPSQLGASDWIFQ